LNYAQLTNLDKQWEDLGHDIGPIQATQIVATATSVKKAGADFICDGTADDVQIQAALDAAHAVGGGTVMLLDGTFTLAAPLEIYDNITFCGTGRGTIIVGYDSGAGTGVAIQNVERNDGNSGIIIRDLWIQGGANELGTGILLQNCIEPPYTSVQKVHFTFTYLGVRTMGSQHVTVDGCSGSGSTTTGGAGLISFEESAYCFAINCEARDWNTIFLIDSNDCMIRSCMVTTHSVAAIYLFGCEHCAVVGCTTSPDATGDPFCGIQDTGSTQNLIVGNVVYKGTTAGITCSSDTIGTVIIGNLIRECTGIGGILWGNDMGHVNISYNTSILNTRNLYTDSVVSQTISYGCINNNELYYSHSSGMIAYAIVHTVVNNNTCIQNGHGVDNTYYNIMVAASGGYNADDNLVLGNLCYKGDASPRTRDGIAIGTGCSDNMVTMNYLVAGGQTSALWDNGTDTDKTAWMVQGNKVA
jgi:hypothetical protein